jgi:hypothetical protein
MFFLKLPRNVQCLVGQERANAWAAHWTHTYHSNDSNKTDQPSHAMHYILSPFVLKRFSHNEQLTVEEMGGVS